MEEATNPELDLVPQETEVETQDGGEDDQSTEPAEPETVEVEVDGQTYNVPAALKDSFLKAADYTQKTQDLAAERRQAAEALQRDQNLLAQQAQMQRQNIALYGELAHTESLLEKFSQVNWSQLQQEDPDRVQELSVQHNILRDKRDDLMDEIESREHDSRVRAEQEYATRKDQLEATLARDIPNYSSDLRKEMDQTAIRQGFSEREVSMLTDPRYVKMMHLAHLGEQVLTRSKAAPKPKLVKPVTKVSTGKTPVGGPKDKQSTEDWMKSRAQQLRKRAG